MPGAGPRAGPKADDRDLVRRAVAGDPAAFTALATRYEGRVLGWARGVVHHVDDARDVVQEVFLRVFRTLPEYRGESAFSTWLYRITFNLSLNWRERVLGRRVPLTPEAEAALPDPGPLVEDRVAAGRQADAVRAAVLRLPAHFQVVIVLHYFRGLTYEETAAVLRLPLNTVKTHLLRAKARLKADLEGRGPG